MPPKNEEKIKAERRRIMDAALDIIVKKGFDALKMRKLASCLGMSATNIYNYFHNKDEVYLTILTEGFELLYEELIKASKSGQNAKESLENIIKAYVDFGISKAYYYDIMYSSKVPKYYHYIGQPHEDIAFKEKETAFKVLYLFMEYISKCFSESDNTRDVDPKLVAMRIISELHGVLNLHHNRILIEVHHSPRDIIDMTVDHIIQTLDF